VPDSPDAPGDDAPERETSPALDELREAVRRATSQIEHLRERAHRLEDENQHLKERVAELEADPAAGRDDTALLVGDDPDALRERIDHFIEALDAELE
jgi:predicted nuclease with TOPRIM domain